MGYFSFLGELSILVLIFGINLFEYLMKQTSKKKIPGCYFIGSL